MSSLFVRPQRAIDGATVCSYGDWQLRQGLATIAFCYRHRLDAKRLRGALEHVLADFPDFTGRMRLGTDALRIEHYRDSGVRFDVVSSTQSFEELTAAARCGNDRRVCPPFSMRKVLAGRETVTSVRLTETSDGCVLVVAWNHAVGDLVSAMQLMNAWSRAYAGESYEQPTLLSDRARYLDEHMPDPQEAASTLHLITLREVFGLIPLIAQRKRRLDFVFSWDQLEQIQAWASRSGFVSTSDSLYAHTAAVLREWSPRRPVDRLALVVNYRKRVGLPETLIGNLIGGLMVDLKPCDTDAASVAAELRAKLNDYARKHADYHATRRFLAQHPGKFARARVVPNALDVKGRTWIVSNVMNSGVYDLAFDGHTPALWHDLTPAPLPYMTVICDQADKSGITLSMQLPERVARVASTPEGRARMFTIAQHAQPVVHGAAVAG